MKTKFSLLVAILITGTVSELRPGIFDFASVNSHPEAVQAQFRPFAGLVGLFRRGGGRKMPGGARPQGRGPQSQDPNPGNPIQDPGGIDNDEITQNDADFDDSRSDDEFDDGRPDESEGSRNRNRKHFAPSAETIYANLKNRSKWRKFKGEDVQVHEQTHLASKGIASFTGYEDLYNPGNDQFTRVWYSPATLQEAARAIPPALQGMSAGKGRNEANNRFAFYISNSPKNGSAKDPSKIMQEWNAYIAGLEASIDLAKKGKFTSDSIDVIAGPLEFMVYGIGLGEVLKEKYPEYWNSDKGKGFKKHLATQIERTMDAFNRGRNTNRIKYEAAEAYYTRLTRTTADGAGAFRKRTIAFLNGIKPGLATEIFGSRGEVDDGRNEIAHRDRVRPRARYESDTWGGRGDHSDSRDSQYPRGVRVAISGALPAGDYVSESTPHVPLTKFATLGTDHDGQVKTLSSRRAKTAILSRGPATSIRPESIPPVQTQSQTPTTPQTQRRIPRRRPNRSWITLPKT